MTKRKDTGDEADAMDQEPLDDGLIDVETRVMCPYCGESIEIALDPGSGENQRYVEDCEVCCQPWQVDVHYGADGHATVTVSVLNG
jgi:Cysteine-rich CPXCG